MTTWPLIPDHLETTTLEHLGNVCGFHPQIVQASVNSGFIQRSFQFLGSTYSNTDWEKKTCRGEKWWLTMALHCTRSVSILSIDHRFPAINLTPTSPSSATFGTWEIAFSKKSWKRACPKSASGTVARTHPKSSKYMQSDGIRASFWQLIAVSKMHLHHCTQHKP